MFLSYCVHKNGLDEHEATVTLTFDLRPPKSNQFISESQWEFVQSLMKIQWNILETLRSQEWQYARMDGWMTKSLNASGRGIKRLHVMFPVQVWSLQRSWSTRSPSCDLFIFTVPFKIYLCYHGNEKTSHCCPKSAVVMQLVQYKWHQWNHRGILMGENRYFFKGSPDESEGWETTNLSGKFQEKHFLLRKELETCWCPE